MSTLLKEILAAKIDQKTKNGGASSQCALWAAQLPVAAAVCAAYHGVNCACDQYWSLVGLMGKYCK